MATVILGPFAAEFAGVPPALELEEQSASDRQVISASVALTATALRRRGRGGKMFTPPSKSTPRVKGIQV
jgi:hypothetical protein